MSRVIGPALLMVLLGCCVVGCGEEEEHPPWPPGSSGSLAAYQFGGATPPTRQGGSPADYAQRVDATAIDSADAGSQDADFSSFDPDVEADGD